MLIFLIFFGGKFMPGNKEEYIEIENEIKERRQLPYTLTVEKIEGDKVYTRNIWGNSVVYLKKSDGNYDMQNE
jgi:hypothetical protein